MVGRFLFGWGCHFWSLSLDWLARPITQRRLFEGPQPQRRAARKNRIFVFASLALALVAALLSQIFLAILSHLDVKLCFILVQPHFQQSSLQSANRTGNYPHQNLCFVFVYFSQQALSITDLLVIWTPQLVISFLTYRIRATYTSSQLRPIYQKQGSQGRFSS